MKFYLISVFSIESALSNLVNLKFLRISKHHAQPVHRHFSLIWVGQVVGIYVPPPGTYEIAIYYINKI